MKKSISLLMVVAMLLSSVLFVVPTSASQETSKATAVNIDYIDALYFENAPTVDGYVSDAEWGSYSFSVEADDAATKDDSDPYNRFIYWRTGDLSDYSSWAYTVWMRWDENYFYLAVKVDDPDVHALKNGTCNTWNGDAIQMRVDAAGPNAIVNGQEFTVSESYTMPWSSSAIPDLLFGYVEIAGGFSEAWENSSNKGMTAFSKNPMGTAQCVVAPAGSNYSSDTQNGITTYEVAIPWAYLLNGVVDSNNNQITALTYTTYSTGRKGNLAGGIGRELGISLVCLDDGTNPDSKWDAFLAWGSGICGAHQTEGARSATGSNSVVLSGTKVTQTAGYTTYNPQSLLDASFSQENIDPKGVFYDYLAGDFYKETKLSYDQLSVLTYDTDPASDLSIWGAPEYKGAVTDIGGEHKNVLDYSKFFGKDQTSAATDVQTYIDTRDGDLAFQVPTSYTFEFDICYTDNVVVAPSYQSSIHNWFGGASIYNFECGYFFNDSMFKIVNTDDEDQVIASKAYDLKKNNWYTWRFQFDNESCTARLWIDDKSTTADDGEGWGELIFNTCWRYFYYAGVEETLLLYRMMNTQVMYDNIKVYNFGSISTVQQASETDGSKVNGGGSGTTTTVVTGGGQITIDESKVYKKDNQWHVPVSSRSEYANATQLSFTFNYDATKAKFNSISGLTEGTYTVEETTAGTVVLTIKDFAEVKKIAAGETLFEFVLDATDGSATVKDLKLSLSDSYIYTVTTGDTMTFVIIGCIAAIAIVTSVVVIRRRKENE